MTVAGGSEQQLTTPEKASGVRKGLLVTIRRYLSYLVLIGCDIWWSRPGVPALRRLKQEFQANLSYKVRASKNKNGLLIN